MIKIMVIRNDGEMEAKAQELARLGVTWGNGEPADAAGIAKEGIFVEIVAKEKLFEASTSLDFDSIYKNIVEARIPIEPTLDELKAMDREDLMLAMEALPYKPSKEVYFRVPKGTAAKDAMAMKLISDGVQWYDGTGTFTLKKLGTNDLICLSVENGIIFCQVGAYEDYLKTKEQEDSLGFISALLGIEKLSPVVGLREIMDSDSILGYLYDVDED